jgi:hypothetical protein
MASIKLSVTHRGALRSKYRAPALAKIDKAVRAWVAADQLRGLQTVHVALDDRAAMRALGVPAVTGRLTALGAKRAIDALVLRLKPDYIVIIGGNDVVPQFQVVNPSFDPEGDDDTKVQTDNPYACSRPYRAARRSSYLVPDRVLGRIPDVPCAEGAGDPGWLVTALRHASACKPRPRAFYADAFAVCAAKWHEAGTATMKFLGLPVTDLLLSPPRTYGDVKVRDRLARKLHVVKCHGDKIDPRFFGEEDTRRKDHLFPDILTSNTLRPRLKAGTLASAMCCYGAQVFAPDDPRNHVPGSWPISMAYLRGGAVGFVGATKIAWVGTKEMACADWIVASYIKKCLEGESTGFAMLACKQDFLRFLRDQGLHPDRADEKTLIEFVLLGDPSVHPVKTTPAAAVSRRTRTRAAAAVMLAAQAARRAERRAARALLGNAVTKGLPRRSTAEAPEALARKCYQLAVAALMVKMDLGDMNPTRATVTRLQPAAAAPRAAAKRTRGAPAAAAQSISVGDAMEYGWSSRQDIAGIRQIRLLNAQFDANGNLLRSRVLNSA